MSSLNYFPLEPGCENYSFLDQAVADIKQGLDSILINSIKMLFATLDTEQLISCIRVAHVDTISSLQDSEGEMISNSDVYELLTKIYDVLDNDMSKWTGNTACIFSTCF